ncbi:uncharacterized protein F4822DRAFT_93145 [Hypoxylon trugodes]|uniref:uncharacterized protein n=1 Tax=Hypoxylon trugodes TaxID=326681 RepID=UPI00219B4B3E|nr:uncharacterized protein F4822DRAFT_93145 [Hypoxylon trugodes]KAI1383119.1 hypothetical protein F4822DRAFT_93145 [Hypoxylon trugodes]
MLAITTITAVLAFAVNSVLAAPTNAAQLVARQGYVASCTSTYTVQQGDTCNKIINTFNGNFTLQEFYTWNPQVDSVCSNLFVGEVVCIGVADTTTPPCPAPYAPGLNSNCKSCYKVVSGDTCLAVANKEGISLSNFESWNPDINAACTNLQLGYNYCVGV